MKLKLQTSSVVGFVLLMLASATASATQLKSMNCKSILQAYPWVRTTQDYSEAVSRELHSTSMALEKEIHNTRAVVLDVVGIGGGPQSAIAFSVMKQLNPKMTSVIFEASNRVGTFDKLSRAFRLNSPENEDFQGVTLRNLLVGAPVQVMDFLSGDGSESPFPSSGSLGNATLLAYYYADAGLVFNQKVDSVRSWPEENRNLHDGAKYEVSTQGGLRVFAKHIILAPGLGQPRTGIQDVDSLKLVQKSLEAANHELKKGNYHFHSGIETVDLFLQRIAESLRSESGARETASILQAIPSDVMVVGGGDGGKAVVETILGLQQQSQDRSKRHHVLWAGQSALDSSEFMKSLTHPIIKKRYAKIASYYDEGTLQPISKKVTKIIETSKNGRVAYEVTLEPRVRTESQAYWEQMVYDRDLKDSERTVEKVTVQHIIFATGYDAGFPNIFKELPAFTGDSISYQYSPISDYLNLKLESVQSEVNQQVGWRAQQHSIWRIGHGSTAEIPRTSHGGPFDLGTFGPLSAAMARRVAHELIPAGAGGQPLLHLVDTHVHSKRQSIEWKHQLGLQVYPKPEEGPFLLESKVLVGRLLNGFRFAKNARYEIQIAVSPTDFFLTTQGMDEKSTRFLGSQLEQHTELSGLLAGYLSRKSGEKLEKLTIRFQSRSDGTARFETAEFKLE